MKRDANEEKQKNSHTEIHKKIPVRLLFTFIKCNLKDYPTYFCNVSITAPGLLVISVKYWQVSSASPAS